MSRKYQNYDKNYFKLLHENLEKNVHPIIEKLSLSYLCLFILFQVTINC